MASNVSICSNALLLLGGQTINDLDEDNDRARLANNLFPQVRDEILRSHAWNCCIKRVILSPDVEAPLYDYAYQFTLPTDWMRTIVVGEYGYEEDYRMEGRKILSDNNILRLRYVFNNTNAGAWDASLIGVMTKAMAAHMAYAITQSSSLHQLKLQELEQALRSARSVDGQEEPPETLGDFRLLSSRY